LIENFKAGTAEDRNGAIVVVGMNDESATTMGTGHDGVTVMDVDFGLEKGGEEASKVGGFDHFDDDDFGVAVGDALLGEEFFDAVGIAHDDADDGGIGGILHAEGDDLDMFVVEKFNEVEKGAGAVFGKDGEMLNAWGVEFFDSGIR